MTTPNLCPGGRELCQWALVGMKRLTCKVHPIVNATSPFESHHDDDGSPCTCKPSTPDFLGDRPGQIGTQSEPERKMVSEGALRAANALIHAMPPIAIQRLTFSIDDMASIIQREAVEPAVDKLRYEFERLTNAAQQALDNPGSLACQTALRNGIAFNRDLLAKLKEAQ